MRHSEQINISILIIAVAQITQLFSISRSFELLSFSSALSPPKSSDAFRNFLIDVIFAWSVRVISSLLEWETCLVI